MTTAATVTTMSEPITHLTHPWPPLPGLAAALLGLAAIDPHAGVRPGDGGGGGAELLVVFPPPPPLGLLVLCA